MNKKWTIWIITVIAFLLCLLIGLACLFSTGETREPSKFNLQDTRMKILYTETADDVTTIWIAQIPDLKHKTVLAQISHANGYPIKAVLSPDGKKIAYTLLSPGAGDPSYNGSLWVMYLNQPPKKLDEKIDYYVFPKWTQNSTGIVSLKTIPNPSRYHTELYVVSIDGIKKDLLLSDDVALSINPIGWANNIKLFYYARITSEGDDLWAVSLADANPRFITHLSEGAAWNLTLNANGKEIIGSIIESQNPTSYAVISLSTDGKNRHVWMRGAKKHYTPIWGPSIHSITTNIPKGSYPTHPRNYKYQGDLKILSRITDTEILLDSSDEWMDVPVSWSPDSKWLVYERYHQSSLDLYVMGHEGMTHNLISALNWPQFVGWITN